jgi:hypothetical protein
MFISKPSNGLFFIAELSRFGSQKLLWSIVPVQEMPTTRIEARSVPLTVRRAAYRLFSRDRKDS